MQLPGCQHDQSRTAKNMLYIAKSISNIVLNSALSQKPSPQSSHAYRLAAILDVLCFRWCQAKQFLASSNASFARHDKKPAQQTRKRSLHEMHAVNHKKRRVFPLTSTIQHSIVSIATKLRAQIPSAVAAGIASSDRPQLIVPRRENNWCDRWGA